MQSLIPEFEGRTGHNVELAFDIINAIAERIRAGEGFDLAIETPRQWDALAAEGNLAQRKTRPQASRP